MLSLYHTESESSLKGFSSEDEEVRELLHALKDLVDENENMNAQAVGNVLYGMGNMTDDHPEVREMLHVIGRKLSLSTMPLLGEDINYL
jgi:hypothetical protein